MQGLLFSTVHSWLSSNSRGWRLFVGCICVVGLTLFLHFREVRLEVLEINATAPRYVVAQIDFEFPDYERTIVLKQQAMQEIGEIYQLDEKQVRKVRFELENVLIHDKGWRTTHPTSTFEEMYKAADEVETLLLEARFTDPRTIQKIRQMQHPDSTFYEFLPDPADQAVVLPIEIWEKIGRVASASDVFHPGTVSFILAAFQRHHWNLHPDEPLVHSLRAQATRTVEEKLTQVKAGMTIVDQGERITSRHLTMMQSMKQAISESRKLDDFRSVLASLLLSMIFVTISALYFRISQPTFIRSLREISLFVCVVLLTLCFAKLTELILLKSSLKIIESIQYPIVAPFATILICILLSPRTALFAATFLSIILSVSLAVDHSRFLVLNLVTSIVVIISTKGLRKRNEVFVVCGKSWLSSIPVFFAYALSEGHFWRSSIAIEMLGSFLSLLLIAVLVVGLVPALESLFGVMTDMTLMEYMDPNQELLKRLCLEVPGTYQHSLVLGNLAETCAQAIGANGLFCRVATLYHDIGKMMNPMIYTENQQDSVSIHQLLTPVESAQVIISHVTDGEMLAKKYHLPPSFIDIIREHHGTTLVYYFYRKQLALQGGRKEEVELEKFRYPGPKPRSKESAVIMICDTVEAASRSMEEVSEKAIEQLVDRLVAEKAEEGQFDDCQLTFEELGKVKRTLVRLLLLAHHTRVKYPKRIK
jgi:putative nucleotidyltransferase with HDIG domain